MSEPGENTRAEKRRTGQIRLWCRCGSPQLASRGLCAACYAREQHMTGAAMPVTGPL
jgi:hypothetical protein